MSRKNILGLIKKINRGAEGQKSYNTGLVGESLIISSYKTMPLDKLEKMRFIINKIIKEKKIRRLHDDKNASIPDNNRDDDNI